MPPLFFPGNPSVMKLILFITLLLSWMPLYAQVDLYVESGAVWQNRNDFQIPPEAPATRVELDRFNEGPFFHYRSEVFYRPSKNHGFRLLWAPFSVTLNSDTQSPILFNGTQFTGGPSGYEFQYTFNSYRGTYFYAFWGHGEDQLNLGVTAKIREAKIQVRQGSQVQSYTNLGFVPLIYFEYQKKLAENWLFNFQMDGLAGGPGRAFDVALKIRHNFSEQWMGSLGYRVLEGGADNDEVFTFSWFNYAVLDVGYSF